MSTNDFSIRNYYPRDIPIDDGYDGDAVAAGKTFPVRIRRFSIAELQAFQRGYARLNDPASARFIFRKSDGDEQALREDGKTHVVPDAEIERRRLDEMSPETRANYDAALDADDAFMTTFCQAAITEHMWLPAGVRCTVLQDDDSAAIVVEGGKGSGAGLVTAFGGNLSMLIRLTRAIHQENTLSPEAKKALRSLSDLTASSPPLAGDGKTPAAIAGNAAPAGTASSGAASVDPDPIPSGSIPAAASS